MVSQHKGADMEKRLDIVKVVRVEVGPNGRKEKELKGKDLKQWKIEHGYIEDDSTEEKNKPDTSK